MRNFFRFAAQQGWCRSDLALAIDLPRLYALEDVPSAPTTQDVDRPLEAMASGDDPVEIRDHAILSLLIHYGLRRGEVERLTTVVGTKPQGHFRSVTIVDSVASA